MRRYHHLVWDERNIYHIDRHGVTPDEIEQIVYSSDSRIRRGREQKLYYVLGQTEAGRYLFVVLREFRESTARPITAREMTHQEKKWLYRHTR